MHRKSIEAAEKLRSDSEEDGDDMISIDGDHDQQCQDNSNHGKDREFRSNEGCSPINANQNSSQQQDLHKPKGNIDSQTHKKAKERKKNTKNQRTSDPQTIVDTDHSMSSLSSSPSQSNRSNEHFFSHHSQHPVQSPITASSLPSPSTFAPVIVRDDSWSSSIANLRAKALEHQAKVLSQQQHHHNNHHHHHPVHHHAHGVLTSHASHASSVLSHPNVLTPPSTTSSSLTSVSPSSQQQPSINTTLSHLYSTFDPTKVPSYPFYAPAAGRPIYWFSLTQRRHSWRCSWKCFQVKMFKLVYFPWSTSFPWLLSSWNNLPPFV